MRRAMLQKLADLIVKAKGENPLRVGIDGVDAAGKTRLADELAGHLAGNGRAVLRASIDGFHHPGEIRYRRGPLSPEGYYYDSFNYDQIRECLLEPLSPAGSRRCRLSAFDFKTGRETLAEVFTAGNEHVLLFEGVFLFRPELYPYWDVKIFVDIDFTTSLARAIERDGYLFGDAAEIEKRYREKYIPGQQIYLDAVRPKEKADVLIDNNDYANPVIRYCRLSGG